MNAHRRFLNSFRKMLRLPRKDGDAFLFEEGKNKDGRKGIRDEREAFIYNNLNLNRKMGRQEEKKTG